MDTSDALKTLFGQQTMQLKDLDVHERAGAIIRCIQIAHDALPYMDIFRELQYITKVPAIGRADQQTHKVRGRINPTIEDPYPPMYEDGLKDSSRAALLGEVTPTAAEIDPESTSHQRMWLYLSIDGSFILVTKTIMDSLHLTSNPRHDAVITTSITRLPAVGLPRYLENVRVVAEVIRSLYQQIQVVTNTWDERLRRIHQAQTVLAGISQRSEGARY